MGKVDGKSVGVSFPTSLDQIQSNPIKNSFVIQHSSRANIRTGGVRLKYHPIHRHSYSNPRTSTSNASNITGRTTFPDSQWTRNGVLTRQAKRCHLEPRREMWEELDGGWGSSRRNCPSNQARSRRIAFCFSCHPSLYQPRGRHPFVTLRKFRTEGSARFPRPDIPMIAEIVWN